MGPTHREYGAEGTGGSSRGEQATIALAERAVAHTIETGHDIDSTSDGPPHTGANDRREAEPSADATTGQSVTTTIYCLECGWAIGDTPGSKAGLAVRPTEQSVRAGSAADGRSQVSHEPTEGWASEWPPDG